MDANETLCILLQHLQSDPGSLTERSTIDLILKSLRCMAWAWCSRNQQSACRQETVQSCNIKDVTQLAKHSDTIQNESKVLERG